MSLRNAILSVISVLVGLLIIAIWQLIADFRVVSPVFLPGPDRAFRSLVTGIESGDLLTQTFFTIQHMAYGWLLASLIGIALGVMVGSSAFARDYIGPTLEFMRPLPASAIAPVAIAFFGLSNTMVLTVIAFGTLWPMLLSTAHGVATVEPRLVEVGQTLRLGRMAFIRKIALPNAVPDILSGMRLGLTVALILAVVGEMLTAQNGLGARILLAARSFRSADLFAGIMLLGLIGFLSNSLLAAAERRLLRWRPVIPG